MRCLLVAPGSTPTDFRTSETLFRTALSGPCEQAEIEVQWARRVASPATTPGTPRDEVEACDFVLAEVTRNDPVVFFYLGLSHSLGKPIVTLQRAQGDAAPALVPYADFHARYELSGEGRSELNLKLQEIFADIARVQGEGQLGDDVATELDWGRIGPEAHQRLCWELLLLDPRVREASLVERGTVVNLRATGERTLEAEKGTCPWLVVVGGNLTSPSDVVALAHDAQTLRESGRLPEALEGPGEIHVLFASVPATQGPVEIEPGRLRELEERLVPVFPGGPVRLSIACWQSSDLERRVRRHPSLLLKYFGGQSGGEDPSLLGGVSALYREAVSRLDDLVSRQPDGTSSGEGVAESAWQNLAYTATHSIGNSLFPIEAYLVALQDLLEEEENEDGIEAATKALENVERAKFQIERFKALSADRKPTMESVDLDQHLGRPLAYAESKGIEVSRFGATGLVVWSDPYMLDEIFDEMVTNALSWMGSAGRLGVTISLALPSELPSSLTRSKRAFVRLRWEDNGEGVRHEDKERIFELFFSRNPQGKGIGLTLCRKYVREFGGDMLESGTPGVGARFEIFLPATPGERSSA